ncbi:MAG TPA: helix-turn-helix transcriptional regulator [Verrucomicrobiae bacterium]|nr:helix-turn-helix transcriptional regulator [Verrucomicrobiae bacterium]
MEKPGQNLADARSRRPAPASAMFSEQAWQEIARSLALSPRELQIVRGIFNDHTEFAIAADLGMSVHTVHTHIHRLHRKLGVTDRVGLILRVTNEFLTLTAAPESTLPSICANRTAGRCPLRS